MTRSWLLVLSLLAACHDSGQQKRQCPTLSCLVACPSGTRKDDNTGCDTCLCAGGQPDAGACPATSCSGSCGLGNAVDPATGCPTCTCCNPADCEPGGCHGTGADGCPTCGPC
jgi:hypothetical protein